MSSADQQQRSKTKFRWPQIGLSTLLLLTACIAVWCGVWLARRQTEQITSRLAQTQALSRELTIRDRTLLTAIKQDEMFPDENEWQVFVPREKMQLKLVTTQIAMSSALPTEAEKSVEIQPGVHRIGLKIAEVNAGWSVTVHVDSEEVMRVIREPEWNPNKGASGTGVFGVQMHFKDGEPAVLLRRKFEVVPPATSSHWPGQLELGSNGVLLWIEE